MKASPRGEAAELEIRRQYSGAALFGIEDCRAAGVVETLDDVSRR